MLNISDNSLESLASNTPLGTIHGFPHGFNVISTISGENDVESTWIPRYVPSRATPDIMVVSLQALESNNLWISPHFCSVNYSQCKLVHVNKDRNVLLCGELLSLQSFLENKE